MKDDLTPWPLDSGGLAHHGYWAVVSKGLWVANHQAAEPFRYRCTVRLMTLCLPVSRRLRVRGGRLSLWLDVKPAMAVGHSVGVCWRSRRFRLWADGNLAHAMNSVAMVLFCQQSGARCPENRCRRFTIHRENRYFVCIEPHDCASGIANRYIGNLVLLTRSNHAGDQFAPLEHAICRETCADNDVAFLCFVMYYDRGHSGSLRYSHRQEYPRIRPANG
jgi:hypothetical protein